MLFERICVDADAGDPGERLERDPTATTPGTVKLVGG
jgi:hypothetical protein